MDKNYFTCECGEKVKLTKYKVDIEKGLLREMSDVEISCFRHNKKCSDCIEKEDDEKKKEEDEAKVNIWRAYITYDDDAKPLFFKNKENAIVDKMDELKKIFEDENSYDHDGDL